MDVLLGVDVGGTNIKAGLFTTTGELLDSVSFPTPQMIDEAAYKVVSDGLEKLVEATADAKLRGIGLDCPGPISEDGKLLMTANVNLDLEGLKAALKERFDVYIAVLNDANAAALGEMWRGGALQYRNFYMITLGTGVGGGCVIDGKVVAGVHGCSGEIGHVIINHDETNTCGCGRCGCLEQYASAPGVVRTYLAKCKKARIEPCEISHPSDAKAVFDAYVAGDRCAAEAIDVMCDSLAKVMAGIAVVVNPEAFVFGGGVAGGFDLFADRLKYHFDRYTLAGCKETSFERARLGNAAGSYGAAFEVKRNLRGI